MKKKTLRLRDLNVGNCLTVGELQHAVDGWVHSPSTCNDNGDLEAVVVIKIGRKNFSLSGFGIVDKKFVIYGDR